MKQKRANNKYTIFSALCALLFSLLIICLFLIGSQRTAGYANRTVIDINGTTITVEVAEKEEERVQGLSGRSSLKEGRGMLFIFEQDGAHGIWMKDMHFPIDILWISSDREIIHIERMVSPQTYPDIYSPPEPARYVLEVPAGYTVKKQIQVGDRAVWQ